MKYVCFFLFFLFFSACSSMKVMEDEGEGGFKGEYKKLVKIEAVEKPKEPLLPLTPPSNPPPPLKKETNKAEKLVDKKVRPRVTKKLQRQPKLENSEGFDGRRPLVDPFVVGEKTVLDLTYFGVKAGQLLLEVRPFVDVNERRAYHFVVSLKSSKMFSYFYSVDDVAETYMDYESMLPSAMHIRVRESQQIKEIRSFFDWDRLKGTYWERKIKKGEEEKKRKKEWDIESFSHNVVSALYYMRVFQLKPKKKLSFRVADDGKNLIVRGEVLRREKLETPLGGLDTVVLKNGF